MFFKENEIYMNRYFITTIILNKQTPAIIQSLKEVFGESNLKVRTLKTASTSLINWVNAN